MSTRRISRTQAYTRLIRLTDDLRALREQLEVSGFPTAAGEIDFVQRVIARTAEDFS